MEKIHESSHLENDLGFDSLDKVETLMEVEEHFDISVPDEESQNINTVGDIADGVSRAIESGVYEFPYAVNQPRAIKPVNPFLILIKLRSQDPSRLSNKQLKRKFA